MSYPTSETDFYMVLTQDKRKQKSEEGRKRGREEIMDERKTGRKERRD